MAGNSTEILGGLKHAQETIPSRRILILATSYAPLIGGAELAIQNLTDRLSEFSFDLITSLPRADLPRTERVGNVQVFRVGGALGQATFLLPKVFLPLAIFSKGRELLARNSYDLIYVLQASQAGGAAWLLKTFGRTRVPIALNLQDGKDLERQSFLTRWSRDLILYAADYFVVISTYLQNFLLRRGVPQQNIFLIPNGITTTSPENAENIREKLGLKDERVIVTVSRLVEKNGIEDLLNGFADLKKKYTAPLKLVIIGSGDLDSSLKAQTTSLGIDSDVIYAGAVNPKHVSAYLMLSEIFIRPSRSEGLGTAFLEAMALGIPIIGTRVGGIPDFLKDGETGLFCEVGNSQDISRQMLRLLMDEALSRKISSQGRELVLRNYTWDIVAQQFRLFYKTITERQPA